MPDLPRAVPFWKVPKGEDLSVYYKMLYVTLYQRTQPGSEPVLVTQTQSLWLKLSLCLC